MNEAFRDEFYQLQRKYSEKMEKSVKASVTWSDFSKLITETYQTWKIMLLLTRILQTAPRASRKALFIAIMIIVINECCGSFILVSYTATIFATSGSVLSPNLSAIIVGLIQLIGTYISTMYIDKKGRKVGVRMSTNVWSWFKSFTFRQ